MLSEGFCFIMDYNNGNGDCQVALATKRLVLCTRHCIAFYFYQIGKISYHLILNAIKMLKCYTMTFKMNDLIRFKL